ATVVSWNAGPPCGPAYRAVLIFKLVTAVSVHSGRRGSAELLLNVAQTTKMGRTSSRPRRGWSARCVGDGWALATAAPRSSRATKRGHRPELTQGGHARGSLRPE